VRRFYLFLRELPSPLKNVIRGYSACGQAATVQSGETTTVSLELCSVTARLSWPAGVERQTNWRVKGSIEFIGDFPEGKRPLNEAEDGTWRAEDLPAGNYTARFDVFGRNAENEEGKPLWVAEAPIVISADPPDGMVDAGEITLRPAQ
jgi:hypothetical protein